MNVDTKIINTNLLLVSMTMRSKLNIMYYYLYDNMNSIYYSIC